MSWSRSCNAKLNFFLSCISDLFHELAGQSKRRCCSQGATRAEGWARLPITDQHQVVTHSPHLPDRLRGSFVVVLWQQNAFFLLLKATLNVQNKQHYLQRCGNSSLVRYCERQWDDNRNSHSDGCGVPPCPLYHP